MKSLFISQNSFHVEKAAADKIYICLNHSTDENFFSISDYINCNREEVLQDFQLVHSLISKRVCKKSSKSEFLGGEINIFDITSWGEKNSYQLPGLRSILKLLVLRKIFERESPSLVSIEGVGSLFSETLYKWCENKGVEFIGERGRVLKSPSIFCDLCQSFVFYTKLFIRTVYLNFLESVQRKMGNDAQDLFVSYFPGELSKPGMPYKSTYWNRLHDLIESSERKCDWLLYYSSPTEKYKNIWKVRKKINQYNKIRASENQKILFIEDYLKVKDLFSVLLFVLRSWFHVDVKFIESEFYLFEEEYSCELFIRNVLYKDIFGPRVFSLVSRFYQFKNLFKQNKYERVFYLYENLSWERILLSFSHKLEIESFAVAHSTVRHFDFRYLKNYQEFANANIIISNGPSASRVLKINGHSNILELEALRYDYLLLDNVKFSQPSDSMGTILFLTDLHYASTYNLLKTLAAVVGRISRVKKILVKTHPLFDVQEVVDELGLIEYIKISDDGLEDILKRVSLVVTTNETSASVESYLMNICTAVVLPEDGINSSPLVDLPGVKFLGNSDDLVDFVLSEDQFVGDAEFFNLDRSYEGWRKILK